MGRNLERKVWSLSCKWGSGVTTWRPEGSGGAAQKGVAPIRLGNAEKALGATRPRRDTGSLHAHARALTGTHTTTGCTHVHCARRGPRRGGGRREERQPGPGSPSRRAPAKACATGGGSSPPRPAQAGCSGEGTGERGVSPAALGAEGRGGARPWGRGPGAYKITLRPDINKPCQATLSCG